MWLPKGVKPMAGRIQKPYEQLQHKRGRRRNLIVLLPDLPEKSRETTRQEVIAAATAHIERTFGRGEIARSETLADAGPRPRRERRYAPKGERKPNEARKLRAAKRERDPVTGHYLPHIAPGQSRTTYERKGWPYRVKRRDGFRCTVAGCETPEDRLQAHHIVPLKAGGPSTLENGSTLCHEHHKAAHAQLRRAAREAAHPERGTA